MELRTVLYGYEKHQFEYFVVDSEAAIVRRIFEEYLSGNRKARISVPISNGVSTNECRTEPMHA